MDEHAAEPEPVSLYNCETPRSPLILSVPHAGRYYPRQLLDKSSASLERLQSLEDRFVDMLAVPLADRGYTVIVAQMARAWIDLNRSEREIDPEMVAPQPSRSGLDLSTKVRGGLGLVPRRVAGHGEIYREPMSDRDVSQRIVTIHRPFHDAISNALDAARGRFGTAVLLDCHSMPPLRPKSGHAPSEIVVGDLNGRSAAPCFSVRADAVCRASSFRVARNMPYAGGYILSRHGRPERHIHALQLEICRSLYLDASRHNPGPRLAEISQLIGRIADGLAEEALATPDTLAAE
ncbi:MAG: N-formylglutamate amidohydrolase [Sphingomonadaceae bacterium]|nr:N-formylglutamate amidohydrolase [Sphingomonadaceae bacterium]